MCIGRRVVVTLLLACSTSLGAGSSAMALGFDEFNRLLDDQKENFIQTALHFYYYGYKNNPRTVQRANCMFGLNERIAEDGKSYLWLVVVNDLNTVQVSASKRDSVEGVIKATIERECRAQ